MRVTNFCYILGRGNGGWLIRGTAYRRVYMVFTFWSFAYKYANIDDYHLVKCTVTEDAEKGLRIILVKYRIANTHSVFENGKQD